MNTQPNQYDGELIAGLEKAVEKAERVNRSIVVSSHKNGKRISMTVTEQCPVTWGAGEVGEQCTNFTSLTCDKCGDLCRDHAEASCFDGGAHENLRRI